MLPIYICDDDRYQLEKYKKLVIEIIETEKLTEVAEVVCTSHDPEEILKQLDKNVKPGLYFLDVKLGSDVIDGIELGVRIRELDPKAYIVMVTVHVEATPKVFEKKVEAKDYILKNRTKDIPGRIRRCVIDAYNTIKQTTIEFPGFIINADEIYYIQVVSKSKRLLRMCGRYKNMQIHNTLNEVEKKLDNSFVRCNRASIVNLKYVVGVDKKRHKVMLEGGIEIPVSLVHMGELEKRYLDYD